jgi:hypothetical protein
MSHVIQDTYKSVLYIMCTGLQDMLCLTSTGNQKQEWKKKTATNRFLSNNSFAKLVNTSSAFCGIQSFTKILYILNKRNEILILRNLLFNAHFNISLPTTSSSSKYKSEYNINKNPKNFQLVVLEFLFIVVHQMTCYLKPVNNGNIRVGWKNLEF